MQRRGDKVRRKWGWEGGGSRAPGKRKSRSRRGVWTKGEEKIYHSPAQEANKFTTGCAQGVNFKIVSCFASVSDSVLVELSMAKLQQQSICLCQKEMA